MKLRDLPLRLKFLGAMLVVTLSALLFTCSFLIANEWRTLKTNRAEAALGMAAMIAANAPTSLIYDDIEEAQQILGGAGSDPRLVRAAIYRADGTIYATFPTNTLAAKLPKLPEWPGVEFARDRLNAWARMYDPGGRQIGMAFVQSDLDPMLMRFRSYLGTVAVVVAVSILLVLFLARLLERWVTQPIQELSQTAQAVATTGDFSLRAPRRTSDEVGRLVDAFNGMLRDIQQSLSKRREAEAALRTSEEQLQLVADNVPALISYVDRDKRYRFVNKAYEDWFGLPADQIPGRTMQEVLGNDAWKKIGPLIERTLSGESVEYDIQAEYKHGGARWIHASYRPHRDMDGLINGVVVLVSDITARKNAELVIAVKAALAQELALVSDPVEILRITTQRMGEFLGLARCSFLEFQTDTGSVSVPSEWRRHDMPPLDQAYDLLLPGSPAYGKETVALTLRINDTSTNKLTREHFSKFEALGIRALVAAPFAREGRTMALLAAVSDRPREWRDDEINLLDAVAARVWPLIERARTEQALRQAQAALQHHAQELERTVDERTANLRDTVAELEAFSYSIAHDMRAPLRSMSGYASLLVSEHSNQLDDEARDFLRRIRTSAERLDRLIQDVLNYSKVVRGDLPISTVDSGKLIGDIVQTYPNLHPSAADIVIQEPLPQVQANAAALTQVVSNLLGNAVKFVSPGVRPRVVVRAENGKGKVRFWFEDNGIGIPDTARGRIFNIFERVQKPGEYEGTGIGLAIVRKAVERMGGAVGFESSVGEGSRFWVELSKNA